MIDYKKKCRNAFKKLLIIKEFFTFLIERKNYCLLPIAIVLVLLGLLMVFAETSALAPFIYAIF